MNYKKIYELANNILLEKDSEVRKDLCYELSYLIGYWDNAKRYYLHDEFQTESSSCVRTPSRSWNLSVYKHICTKKYIKQLLELKILLLQKLDQDLLDNKVNKGVNKI